MKFRKYLSLVLLGATVAFSAACPMAAAAAEPSAPEVTIGTVEVGEVSMDYCKFGTGERVFVILPGLSIHAVTPSGEAVAQAYAAFAEDYTVYLFDRRTNVPEHYTVEDMAADTAAVMRELGIAHAAVFGASQGGMIAETIALDAPELVDELILASTCPRHNETLDAAEQRWVKLAEEGRGYDLNADFADSLYGAETLKQYRDVLLAGGEGITDEELARFVLLAENMHEFDVLDRLGELQCRTLILGCEGDKVMTAEASRELNEAIPGSECYIYGDEYGHAVYDEAPDYRDRILEFLAG